MVHCAAVRDRALPLCRRLRDLARAMAQWSHGSKDVPHFADPTSAKRSARRRAMPKRRRFVLLLLVLTAVPLALMIFLLAAREYTARQLRAELVGFPRYPNVAALGPGPIVGPPTISASRIRAVLDAYGSPAASSATFLHERGVAYGIDPAYCLAFFVLESHAGTRGIATLTHSVGNIRARPGQAQVNGFRQYADWDDGIEDWYRLMSQFYVGELGLTTVDAIVPVYAPMSDNNDPTSYAKTIKTLVALWRGL